jgi:hypothetical protein
MAQQHQQGQGHDDRFNWTQDLIPLPGMNASLLLADDVGKNGAMVFPTDGSRPYPVNGQTVALWIKNLQDRARMGQESMCVFIEPGSIVC